VADKTRPEVVFYLWAQKREISGRDDPGVCSQEAASHCKAQQPHRETFGDTCQGDYIFCNSDGSPLKPDTVSASVSLLFRNLKLPTGASLHTPRDTHSSHLLSAGVPLTEVSKRLGQVNPHVTATAYVHALPGRAALPQRHGRVPRMPGDR
jgi:integrase